MVTPADGHGERDAALTMIERCPAGTASPSRRTRRYDTRDFVADSAGDARHARMSRSTRDRQRRSAIDGRTTRHPGYAISQQKRKLVEQGFGWMKTVGGLAASCAIAAGRWSTWIFTFTAAAYNIVRLRRLLETTA